MAEARNSDAMARSREHAATGVLARRSRYLLLAVAIVLTAGALGQFFLAGLSVFETPRYWSNHATFGSVLGLVANVAWVPAILGRVGWRLVVGSLLLPVLFTAQHALVAIDQSFVQALHPLNGACLFALSLGIAVRTAALVRRGSAAPASVRRRAGSGTPI